MVSLSANRQKIYYGEITGWEDVVDEHGDKTGEKRKTYSTPQEFLIYVAPSRGDVTWNPFGIGDNYTNVMSTNDRRCPITEDSVLWIGIDPFDSEGNIVTEHNYIVTRRAEGLNSILYAIKKVEVS